MSETKTNTAPSESGTIRLVTVAIMVALIFIFSRFLGITTDALHLGLDFLPVAAVAFLYGPKWSAGAAIAGDLVCAIGMPLGVLNPGITLMAGLIGLTYGLTLRGELDGRSLIIKTVIASLIVAFVIKLLGTSACLSLAYGTPYPGMVISRILNCAVLFALQIVTIPLLYKLIIAKLPRQLGPRR